MNIEKFEIKGTYLIKYYGTDEVVEVPAYITKIDDSAFAGNKFLKSVILPEGLRQIAGSAFSGCIALESVDIPYTVEYIDGFAFKQCVSLKSVNFVGKAEIGKYAEDCTSLLKVIGAYAFEKCSSLESIVIPENVTEIGGGAFQDCNALQTATFKVTRGWNGVAGAMLAVARSAAIWLVNELQYNSLKRN